jgi:hypothetical protein
MARLLWTGIAVFMLSGLSGASAEELRLDLEVPWPMLQADEAGFSHLDVAGFMASGPPGAPALPGKVVNILLPPGHRVGSVRVEAGEAVALPGTHVVSPHQRPWPFRAGPGPATRPDAEIYSSDLAWPAQIHRVEEVQLLRGYAIQPVVVTPFLYLPASGRLLFYPGVTVSVTTEPGARSTIRGFARDAERVRHLVANPAMLERYPTRRKAGRQDTRYVVVTTQELAECPGPDNLQALLDEKEARGISTAVHTVADITSTSPGADAPEKIRNFVADLYDNHGTDFVMFLGDADLEEVGGETQAPLVPVRGFWGDINYGGVELNAPTDLYYACLDGDFDANQNGIFGEPDDGNDLLPELWTGRVPADSCQEVTNFVKKNLAYRAAVGSLLKKVRIAGEKLFEGIYAKDYLEKIHNSSTADGIDTLGFSESSFFTVSTMYDKDLGDNGWSSGRILEILNSGVHILNHLGHSYTNYNIRTITDGLASLTNQMYFFEYAQGCYAGSFDNRTGPEGDNNVVWSQDCFAEHMLLDAHGAFATVHYTRYGVAGPANLINRFFWDAAFRHGMTRLGEMHAYSLEQVSGFIADPYLRWMYYVTCLFGDPELAFHMDAQTDEPILGLPTGPVRFVAVTGEADPPDQTITVDNHGAGTLNWSVDVDAAWLTVQPLSGTAPSQVTLSVDAAAVPVGEHAASLIFTAPGALNSPQTLEVTLTVIDVPSVVAPWVADAPVVDGILEPGEYDSAVALELGRVPPDSPPSTAWLMHDGGHLYLALEVGSDSDADALDAVALLLDNNHDGAWPAAAGDEGMIQIMNDNHAFQPWYNPGTGALQGNPEMGPPGVSGILAGAAPRVVEAAIDLSTSHLQLSPGDTFGMFLFHHDYIQGDEWQVVAYWPWRLDSTDVCSDFGAVTLGINDANLLVNPDALSFEGMEGGDPAEPQDVTVESANGAALSFSVAPVDDWIRISDATGTTPDIIQVVADPAGLGHGPHIGEIQVTSAEAANSPVSIAVTFLVAEQPPAFGIEPAALFFEAGQDGPLPDSQILEVTNIGGGELSWSARVEGDWLEVTPLTGGSTETLTVALTTTALDAGTQVGAVVLEAPGAETAEAPVTLRILLTECETSEDCDDSDACTRDTCLEGACRHIPEADCCRADDECDDEDACTLDECLEGECTHTATDCCRSDSDCDDADPCTQDVCGTDMNCQHIDDGSCQDGDGGCGCNPAGNGRSAALFLLLVALWLLGRLTDPRHLGTG